MPHYARGWRGNAKKEKEKKKQKPKTKLKNPKAHRAGRVACFRSAAPKHAFWPGRGAQDLRARTQEGPGAEGQAPSTHHFPRSQWAVSPCWQTRAHPWGWGSGQTGRLRTIDSDDFMFSSWKSQGKIHKSKSHDLQCPLRNLHQILQNGQLALNIRIPRADYRYEAWKSTSSLREAYVRDFRPGILVIWKAGFPSKARSSLNSENSKLGKFSNSQDVLVKGVFVFQRRFNLICATLIISGGTLGEFTPFVTLGGSAYL